MADTISSVPPISSLRRSEAAAPADRSDTYAFRIGKSARMAVQAVLYGFLLGASGVPMLPWGDAAGFAAVVAMVAVASWAGWFRLGTQTPTNVQRVAMLVGIVGMVAISRGAAAPSAIAAGAFLAILVRALDGREMLYGFFLGVLVAAPLVVSVMPAWLAPEVVSVTGAPYSEEAATAGLVRFAALLLLAGLWHLSAKTAATEREQQRLRLVEAERHAEEAVASERATIARELHDVVAHHVSVMTLQAEGAATLAPEGEPAAAMRQVASSGRDALTELRRMLGVLRDDADRSSSGGDGATRAPVPPQPILADLDRLAAGTEGTGGRLDISIERRGDVRPLPAGVELCAYRIVQEALTNVVRHAGASTTRVDLDYGRHELVVEVTDDGAGLPGPQAAGGGLGLIGMRERVHLLGGTLTAGHRPEGGYRVRATVPLADSAS